MLLKDRLTIITVKDIVSQEMTENVASFLADVSPSADRFLERIKYQEPVVLEASAA